MASVGVEWVEDYNGLRGNLSNTNAQASGFSNTLIATRAFNWGDDLAWDQDFEQAGKGSPSSGTDTTWIDSVEIAFYSGHGSPGRFTFGVKIDDALAKHAEISWGEKRLNWIALDACDVLARDGVFDRWGWPVFHGLHMICGFDTTTSDEAHRGRIFATYLNAGWTVREAWIRACQDTEGSDTRWAYLRSGAADTDTFNDHWFGRGRVSPDPTSPTILFYARGNC